MEFDKSKVYTALNADELKVGSKVIVGDALDDLKSRVETGKTVTKLKNIRDAYFINRFEVEGGSYK